MQPVFVLALLLPALTYRDGTKPTNLSIQNPKYIKIVAMSFSCTFRMVRSFSLVPKLLNKILWPRTGREHARHSGPSFNAPHTHL